MDDEAFAKPTIIFRGIRLLVPLILLAGARCQMFHPRETLSIPEFAAKTASNVEFPISLVRMELAAHDSLEQSLEVFDADLPRAGVFPIWMRLRNDGATTLKLDDSHISVTTQDARPLHPILPKRIVDLLYDSYRTKMYSPYFRDQLEKRLEEMRFKTLSLSPGREASGYLFFFSNTRGYGHLSGARLRWTEIKGSGEPDSLTLEYNFPGP